MGFIRLKKHQTFIFVLKIRMKGIMMPIKKIKGLIMKKISTLLLLTLFLSACAGKGDSKPVGGSKAIDNMNFYQHWMHSYEEQNGDKKHNIFRPKGSRDFPSSRFRMELAFDPSGQCNYMFLSPTDRHEMRNCVYTKIGKKVYIYNDAGKLVSHLSFTLQKAAEKDLMRMSYGVQSVAQKNTKETGSNGKPKS